MKTYNQTNFFKHTFCEFTQIDDFDFPENSNYRSKSESEYHYKKEGVYRKSNHWGRVANCRWKLISNNNYKNQKNTIGFAKWSDFYPISTNEKNFSIQVNFEEKTAKLQLKKTTNDFAFTYAESLKRVKQINHLFKNDKWTKYYDIETQKLYFKVITAFISSDNSLHEIKQNFK